MFTSNSLKDYKLLDCGDKLKLEKWSNVILIRPEPVALWPKNNPDLWKKYDAYYQRSKTGGGSWIFNTRLNDFWTINYKDLTLKVSPTNFKHTGIFPEQASNWDFMYDIINNNKFKRKEIKVLNLFAYSGVATLVCAKAGAFEVVHVDASKGMISWAKENQNLSNLNNLKIRYIVDDCLKFMQKEIRRQRKYDAIIMDPPSYGRGPNNELFKFEDQIRPLIEHAKLLLKDDALFFILNTYTTGYSPIGFKNLVGSIFKTGTIESKEIGIKIENIDMNMPCGFTTRWINENNI